MDLLWFILIGAAAGWLAGRILKGSGFGMVGNIVVGVLGGLLGGWLFPKFGISFGGTVGTLVMATGGAVLLLFLLGLFGSKGRR